MPDRSRKRPRDPNQLAKSIVDAATSQGSTPEADSVQPPNKEKDPAAVALGRRGGLKGGNARAKALTGEERSEIARKAAESRWGKHEA